MEGVFWFCEPSDKTMKKLTKQKNTSESEIGADTEAGFAEMKTAINDLKPKGRILLLTTDKPRLNDQTLKWIVN